MHESEKNEVCSSCGYPLKAGHAPDCLLANKNETLLETDEALTNTEREEFFRLYAKVNGIPPRSAEKNIPYYISSFNP